MSEPVSFKDYELPKEVHKALEDMGFNEPTSTQKACLPALLKHNDIAIKAKTGSGKTVAFGISLFNRMIPAQKEGHSGVFAMILCPSRELVMQVAEQIRLLAKHHANTKVLTLFGGVPIHKQIASLVHTPSIVVGTPGRVMDLLDRHKLDVSTLEMLVLDEADRMLDMGFSDQMTSILKVLPSARQTLLFSATYSQGIEKITNKYLTSPIIIEVEDPQHTANISQLAYVIQDNRVEYAISAILSHYQPTSTIVFCQTKQETLELAEELAAKGFVAHALNGDLTQGERQQVITQFSIQTTNVLVATDVAARGLDLEQVDLVINASLSDSSATHTHRIGRTGRADKKGTAITLIFDHQENVIKKISDETQRDIPIKHIQALRFHANRIVLPAHECILITSGKKQKISKGDILGALTKKAEIVAQDIGKMVVLRDQSFIAIKQRSVKRALSYFRENKVKGKSLRARRLR